ncbi:MAG: hypothetical protein NTY53_09000, partial [Kiritimatiellaeota bacterium]|nr:hypothetical protein [Kiritimatiellota bacterium]
ARNHRLGPLTLKPGDANPFAADRGELLDVLLEFAPGTATAINCAVRGQKISYDCAKQEVVIGEHRVLAPLIGGKQNLRIIVDRTCYEIHAGGGLVYVPLANLFPNPDDRSVSIAVEGGAANLNTLEFRELHSIWPAP